MYLGKWLDWLNGVPNGGSCCHVMCLCRSSVGQLRFLPVGAGGAHDDGGDGDG